ncbi:MAG: hypothetical protein LQ338_002285 [Usnochroma carphineum]|nr:MAG: hypothetical protein LQ338_002285 [Usnochroma carphineum]
MPAARRSAAFDPISPDLDLDALVQQTPNFEYVTRISCDMIETQGLETFEKLVLLHVIIGGKPLVIEGFHKRLDEWTFTSQWLQDNHGKKFELARNLSKQSSMTVSVGHYLNNMGKLTNQWNRHNYRDRDRQRLYLKDIDCPQVWHDKLKEVIPPSIFYLNDSTGDVGGPGSVDEPNPHAPGLRKGRGVARAGDLMSCLPPAMRADNLMCYIGHEGTYTPAHREMCASLGQNLMVETSGAVDIDGKPTKPGSSIWFMTESKDRHLVSEYWLSTLGHDIEIEAHFAQINAWKSAPFMTYIVEQKQGDFILIPPLAPHQVWNRGTRTMKVAWNRTTVETLELALDEALPRARMVSRDEQYKNKAMIYFALDRYSSLLKHVDNQKRTVPHLAQDLKYSPKIRQLQKDFRRLFSLYTRVLLSEALPHNPRDDKKIQYIPFDSNITCSFCRCNIFNRFLTCPTCIVPLENGEEDTYDICLECYAMGRSCRCMSGYRWVEQFKWQELTDRHERWRLQIIAFEGGLTDKSPQPLHMERQYMKRKPLAQVCQEQLKLRPWLDPKKPPPAPKLSKDADESQVNVNGEVATKKKKPQVIEKGHMKNHVTNYPEPIWKLGVCKCGRAYSYGSLWRAFDTAPLTVMEDPDWQCPHCLRICSCGKCRKVAGMQPYEPTGTVLGYDTRRVADPRSTESLVDFRQSNFEWVKKAGDDLPAGEETRRLSRRVDEAVAAKSQGAALDDDHYVDAGDDSPMTNGHAESLSSTAQTSPNEIPIDPLLGGLPPTATRPSQPTPRREHAQDEADGVHESDKEEPPYRFVAPSALMLEQRQEQDHDQHNDQRHDQRHLGGGFTTDANGIVFQYPDPEDPDPTVPQYAPPQVEQRPQPIEKTEHGKRRRRSDVPQTDMLDPNEANELYHKEQVKRTLKEARHNNRYIIAEAAMSGKSLSVKLKVDKDKLTHIISQPPAQSTQPPGRAKPSMAIVQSDYPSPTAKKLVPNPLKRARIEPDNDFSTSKKHKKIKKPSLPKNHPEKVASKYMEISSASESEDEMDINDAHTGKEEPKPRPLPAYLARKNDVGDNEIPKELSLEPKQRSHLRRTLVDSAVNNRPSASSKHPRDGSEPVKELVDEATRILEANRKAKMRAMQWDQDDDLEDEAEPDTSPEKRPVDTKKQTPAPKPSKTSRLRNGASSVPSKAKATSVTPSAGPKSIFSRGKKIRVVAGNADKRHSLGV